MLDFEKENTLENFFWTEKYRPKKVADCILPDRLQEEFTGISASGEIPNMIFAGTQGSGKTSLALALGRELGYATRIINGSEEGRLFETLRTKVLDFATTVSLTGADRKLLILDEADYIPADTVQPALRNLIESTSANCSFILTCNFPHRIIEPLHSRCTLVDFNIKGDEKEALIKKFAKALIKLLDAEGVEYDTKTVLAMAVKHAPDWRRCINEIQKYTKNGRKLDGNILAQRNTDTEKLLSSLEERNFKSVRKWVGENATLDMSDFVRKLYREFEVRLQPTSYADSILIMADYQYKHAFAADKEINIMAMLIEIMSNCKWNGE